jgi:hypothetical protein
MLRFSITAISFVLFSTISLIAQPEIKAIFTETAPVIDGSVNEDVWKNASLINELFQREPNAGDPVSEKTEFLFLFDHNNIYIGIRH